MSGTNDKDIQEEPRKPKKLDIDTEGLKAADKWIRGLYMILFVVVSYFVKSIIFGIAFLQFLIVLFTGNPNKNLLKFTEGLCRFAYQIYLFLTYGSEEKPFPFSSWPSN